MFEKAWAKIKGNYAQANGGYVIEGMRGLIGVPSFEYNTAFLLNNTFW
jgi:hypothetical protein